MATIRLDSDERRKAIVAAAVPLFARRGFAGTTTKELAEAAGISEALLFRHFPSKKHLYGEILRLGCEGDPALERLAALEPSTATLVHMTRFMVGYFLLGGADRAELDTRLRLLLHSFLEDGEYARELFDTIFERVNPLFVASMVAFVFLPGRASVPYEGTVSELVEEASWFILRGIGMRDAATASALAAAAQHPFQLAPAS